MRTIMRARLRGCRRASRKTLGLGRLPVSRRVLGENWRQYGDDARPLPRRRLPARLRATVQSVGEHGIVLDRTVFYPLGGGQAGDSGVLVLEDGARWPSPTPARPRTSKGSPPRHLARAGAGTGSAAGPAATRRAVTARIDWERRHKLMRFHTTTHLLCHLVPQLVNGCSITPEYARLDFNMTDPLDKEAAHGRHRAAGGRGAPGGGRAITDEELDANPALVKSMSVQPPRGTGASAPSASATRAGRLPALRRHARGQHGRDRRRGRDQDREEVRQHPTGGAGLRLSGGTSPAGRAPQNP
jgi:misacylated tRNA(Ala) deacylase